MSVLSVLVCVIYPFALCLIPMRIFMSLLPAGSADRDAYTDGCGHATIGGNFGCLVDGPRLDGAWLARRGSLPAHRCRP